MSSAIWRPLTFTSLTSTSRSMATPQAPQTTATARLHCLAALTLPHTAIQAATGQRGAEKAPCPPPLPPPVRWASTVSILKQSNWAPATTTSTLMARPHTLITAPTVARLVSHQPHQLPRPLPLSPAPSVTILTFRAPTITTLTLAILLAFISIPTSIHPGGPTAAQSSTVCPWLLLTAPTHPAGTSQSTPHCLDLKSTETARSHRRLIQIDALLTKEVRRRRSSVRRG